MIRINAIAYDPEGNAIAGAAGGPACKTRKALRRHVAAQMGVKWREIWVRGYRIKGAKS